MKSAAYSLLLGGLLLAVPAMANSDMQKEIDDLREDLMVLQRQIYRGAGGSAVETAKSSAVSQDQAAAGNVQVKIGEYDEVIRKVNGRMDTLEYQVKQLENKLDKINRDMVFYNLSVSLQNSLFNCITTNTSGNLRNICKFFNKKNKKNAIILQICALFFYFWLQARTLTAYFFIFSFYTRHQQYFFVFPNQNQLLCSAAEQQPL